MTDTEKIVAAIEKQRWFRFKNKPKVIFDRDTNLLWADLNHFPYGKNNNTRFYSANKYYAEVHELLRGKNQHGFGNCGDWTVPTVDEMYQLLADGSFPYSEGGYRNIKSYYRWCVTRNDPGNLYNSGLCGMDLITLSKDRVDAFVIPCSHSLVPSDFKSTLDIFIDNKLEPIFNDADITALFRRNYVAPSIKTVINRPTVDYKTLLADYDLDAIERSPIQYYTAVRSLAKTLTTKFELPAEIDLLDLKMQADNFFERLDKINRSPQSIAELAALENEPRPSFKFLVENAVRCFNDYCRNATANFS